MKRFILAILIIAVVLVIVALATGFMSLRTEGELKAPSVDINATGGTLPKVDVDTKEVVVGTTEALAAALFWFWYGHGYWTEGRQWLEGALAAAPQRARARVRALYGLGVFSALPEDMGCARATKRAWPWPGK